MYNLSDNAWTIMQSVYNRYKSNCDDCCYFYDLQQFGFSSDELMRCCQELYDSDFVCIEYDENNNIYLYMTPKILNCIKK